MSILTKPYFHNELAPIEKLKQIIWPNGPVCPHCGGHKPIYPLRGKAMRAGLWKCGLCRK